MMESLGEQLNGRVELAYEASGFRYLLDVPVASLTVKAKTDLSQLAAKPQMHRGRGGRCGRSSGRARTTNVEQIVALQVQFPKGTAPFFAPFLTRRLFVDEPQGWIDSPELGVAQQRSSRRALLMASGGRKSDAPTPARAACVPSVEN